MILELLRVGHDAPAIAKITQYNARTVRRVVKRFQQEGVTERKPHERKRLKRTPQFLAGLKRSIKRNPAVSQATHAKKRGVSKATISSAVRFDLGMKSYARCRKHLITPKQKIARLAKSKKLLSSLKTSNWSRSKGSAAQSLRFYSDEKYFVVDQHHNRRNMRWIAVSPENVPPIMRSKNPSGVMVMGLVSNEGHVMDPYFFPQGLKINTEVYLDVLQRVMVPWMRSVAAGRPFTFQQDSAPAHKSKKVQAWLKANVPHFWPVSY